MSLFGDDELLSCERRTDETHKHYSATVLRFVAAAWKVAANLGYKGPRESARRPTEAIGAARAHGGEWKACPQRTFFYLLVNQASSSCASWPNSVWHLGHHPNRAELRELAGGLQTTQALRPDDAKTAQHRPIKRARSSN